MLGTRVAHPFGVPLDTYGPALGEVVPLDYFYYLIGRNGRCPEPPAKVLYTLMVVGVDADGPAACDLSKQGASADPNLVHGLLLGSLLAMPECVAAELGGQVLIEGPAKGHVEYCIPRQMRMTGIPRRRASVRSFISNASRSGMVGPRPGKGCSP